MSDMDPKSSPNLAEAYLAWQFIERGGHDCPNGAIRLWKWLICNRQPEGVSIPIRKLAEELGISASSVLRARKFLIYAGLIEGDSGNLFKVGEDGNEVFDPYQKQWNYPGQNTRQLGMLGIRKSPSRNFKITDEVTAMLNNFLAEQEQKNKQVPEPSSEEQTEAPAVEEINVLKTEHEIGEDAAQTTLEELIAAAEEKEKEESQEQDTALEVLPEIQSVPPAELTKESFEISQVSESPKPMKPVDKADDAWLFLINGLGLTKDQIDAIKLLASRKRLTRHERIVAEERRMVVVAECMRRKKSVYLMAQICLCSPTTIYKIVKKIKEA